MIGGYLGYWVGLFAGKWWGHNEAVAASTGAIIPFRMRPVRKPVARTV